MATSARLDQPHGHVAVGGAEHEMSAAEFFVRVLDEVSGSTRAAGIVAALERALGPAAIDQLRDTSCRLRMHVKCRGWLLVVPSRVAEMARCNPPGLKATRFVLRLGDQILSCKALPT